MTNQKKIPQRIDDLFEAHGSERADNLKEYIAHVRSNYATAGANLRKDMFLLIVSVIIADLVRYGGVAEATVASIRIAKLDIIVLVAPPIIGFFGHQFLVAMSLSMILWQALERSYKYILPKAYEHDLEMFAVIPTFFDAARIFTKGWHDKWQNAWIVAVIFFALFIPLAAIVHIGYGLWGIDTIPQWLIVLSIVIGVILWLHGFFCFLGVTKYAQENAEQDN